MHWAPLQLQQQQQQQQGKKQKQKQKQRRQQQQGCDGGQEVVEELPPPRGSVPITGVLMARRQGAALAPPFTLLHPERDAQLLGPW